MNQQSDITEACEYLAEHLFHAKRDEIGWYIGTSENYQLINEDYLRTPDGSFAILDAMREQGWDLGASSSSQYGYTVWWVKREPYFTTPLFSSKSFHDAIILAAYEAVRAR